MKKKGFRKIWMLGVAATLALIFAFTPMSFAARGLTSGDQTIRGAKTFEHSATFKDNLTVEGALLGVNQTSNEFYVKIGSGHDSVGNYGTTYPKPFSSIAYALDQCVANNGDIIWVMAGSTKNITADSGIDIDVAGVTIIGLGNGEDRPIFTATTVATADFKITAANVSIFNLVFKSNITEHDMQIEVTGDDAEIGFCEFREGTSTFEFGIQVGAGSSDNDADRCYIHDCIFYEPTADDGDAAISIAKDMAGVRIENCSIYGDFDLAGIDVPAGGNAQVNLTIKNCLVTNLLTGQHAIQINGTGSTGKIANCYIESDAIGTSIDAGGLEPFNVLWSDGTDQQSAALALAPVAGASVLTTADLTAIEAEVEDGLQAKELDHLCQLTDGAAQKYPLTAVEDSIICKILGDDDPAVCTSYDNSKHSLEAIGDLVALTAQEAEVEDALQAQNLDHVAGVDTTVAADADLTTYAADGSLLSHVMTAGADTSDYQASTDSLEAISVALAAGTGATTALDADHLNHLMDTDGAASVFPEQAQEDSVICKMLGDDDPASCATYDNSTDSLEALGTKTTDTDYWQERTIKATTAFTASEDIMYTVAGGAIRITSLFGKCTTVAAGSPGTMTIEVDATAGAAYDSDLSTTVNVDALAEGSTICFTNAISEGVLILTAAVGAGQPLSWFADAGNIEQTLSSTGTGAVVWYMTYVPLETGVTVTAP